MKLIIFDCDGTLVDSQHNIVRSMQFAFEREELPWPGREATLSIVGLSLPQVMQELFPQGDAGQHGRLTEGYKNAFQYLRATEAHKEPLYQGCREVLDRYHAMDDVVMAIATGKSQRGVKAMLEREGLHGYFASVQTADDAPSKPHPAMIHQAVSETGAEFSNTVMVGDTTYDMAMARNAGVGAIGVSWGYHPIDELKSSGAHDILHEYNQLEASVDGYFGGIS